MRAEWIAYALMGTGFVSVIFCGVHAGVLASVVGLACLAGVDA